MSEKYKTKLTLVDDISDEVDLNREESRYKIVEQPRGFIISGINRPTIYIKLTSNYKFSISDHEEPIHKHDFFTEVGPYNFRSLLSNIIEKLMAGYKRPPKKIPAKLHQNSNYIPPELKKWLNSKVETALNHRIHAQWGRLVALLPENVNKVAKFMFRSTLTYSDLAIDPILYDKHPYLVKDLTKYFSANVLFMFANENYLRMTPELIEQYGGPQRSNNPNGMYDTFSDLKSPTSKIINPVVLGRYNVQTQVSDHVSLTNDEYFELMGNWRELYSYNGKTYRALDVTLNNATNVSGRYLAKYLPFICLERPIYQRLELTALLVAYEKMYNQGIIYNMPHLPSAAVGGQRRNYAPDTEAFIHNANLFQHATADQIKTLLVRVGNYNNHQPYNHRKITQIAQAMSFVLDLPEAHHGNVVGLADKSIDWHRNMQTQMEENRRKLEDPESLNGLPPIDLPRDEHIRFLAKVGDLYDESDVMKHCVYSYKYQTISGRSFIFHIDKDGDMATIEINSAGQLIQAQGIRNRKESVVNNKKTNSAILYGKRVLSAWAKQFPNHESNQSEAEEEDDYGLNFGNRYDAMLDPELVF